MGYFSNGTEGMMYAEQYCYRCIHGKEGMCAVMLAHMTHNYDECNKPDSILHMLIPRKEGGIGNEECRMFHDGEPREIKNNIPLKGTLFSTKTKDTKDE